MLDGTVRYARAGVARIAGAARRARSHAGDERDTALLVVKTVVAATAAWVVADLALNLASPAFAPFTAVLMVQVTVYRSIRQSLLYVLAVIIGVGIEGGLGFALGANIGTFVLVALLAMLVARWRRLENQGSQVATAAFFAYSTFIMATSSQQRLVELGEIVLLVVIGAACGVLANLAYPPLRYRSVVYAVDRLTATLTYLLSEMGEALCDHPPTAEEADDWGYRARRFEQSVAQTRDSVTHAEESLRWNPRRLFGTHPTAFTGYRDVIDALGRTGEQLRAISQGLSHVEGSEQDQTDPPHQSFLSAYGRLLASEAAAVEDLGYVDQLRNYGDVDSLRDHIEQGREYHDRLSEQIGRRDLDAPGQWPLYGSLLVDAERMIEEFEHTRRRLTGADDSDDAGKQAASA